MPAIFSPCDEEDRFLEDSFANLARRLYAASVDGLYVCGATGEGYSMLPAERKKAAEIAAQIGKANGKTTIVHVGTNSSRQSADLAEDAARTGADMVSSMPPPNKSLSQLVDYYATLHKASGLPVLVYHIPQLTGRSFLFEELVQLIEIEGVIGAKFTDWNLFLMQRLLRYAPDKVIFNGYDEMLCPALLYGAHGGIGTNYNVIPQVFVAIQKSVLAGKIERAVELQKKFLEYMEAFWKHGLPQGFEAVAQELALAPWVWRRPRLAFDPETKQRFLKEWRPRFESICSAVS